MDAAAAAAVSVSIVGAGTAGPLLALALKRSGRYAPVLYDAAASFGDVGGGFNLAPNGLRLLERLGLLDKVCEAGVPLRTGHIRTMDGRRVTAFEGSAVCAAFGGLGNVGILRSRFHAIAVAQAAAEGIPIYNRKALSALAQDGAGVTLTFADGSTARSELVVGCDGLRSATREALYGPSHPQFTGMEAVIGLTDSARVATTAGHVTADTVVFQGNGAQFGLYGVAPDTVMWFMDQPAAEATTERWEGDADLAEIRQRLDVRLRELGAAPLARDLVAGAHRVIRYAIYDRKPIPSWTRGRVVLLGDAAHPMSPHLGQGANTALEDAGVLAELLAGSSADYAWAFRQYEQLRQKRTAAIQSSARLMGAMNALKNPWLCWARDTAMAVSFWLAGGPPVAYMYGYDYLKVAQEALRARPSTIEPNDASSPHRDSEGTTESDGRPK